jgi:hypothetical protein
MIKKYLILLALGSLISFSFQTNFGMEEWGKNENKEPKISQSKDKKSKSNRSKNKKSKIYDLLVKKTNSRLKWQKGSEKNETQDEEATSSPFIALATELQLYILGIGLKSIITDNSIYTPLEGVKEYLNTLSFVSKKFQAITKCLGWNYKIDEIGEKSNYKQMVKKCWELDNALEDWLNQNEISKGELLSAICLVLSDRLPLDAGYHLIKMDMLENQDSKILKAKTLFEDKSEEELYEICARVIIGADDQNLALKLLISLPHSDALIPLLLLKKVNILLKFDDDSTLLQRAYRCPNALKQILEYNELHGNADYINRVNKRNSTALEMAASDGPIESVKLLLEYRANPETEHINAILKLIILNRIYQNVDLPLNAAQLKNFEIIHQALIEKDSDSEENKEQNETGDKKNNKRKFLRFKWRNK